MNSLSWLLYLAEVSDSAKGILIIMAIAGVFALVFSWMPFMFRDEDPGDWVKWLMTVPKRSAWIVALGVVIFVLAPSRNTIMLIAASEVGETVLASEQAQQIGGEAGALAKDSLSVLRKFINDQLETEE